MSSTMSGDLSHGNPNKYNFPGWVAIGQAALYPLVIVVSIVQSIVAQRAFDYDGPSVGPSDLISILLIVMSIYTIYMLRELLHDRYDFHGVDTLITFTIWWLVVMEIGGLAIKIAMVALWPISPLTMIMIWVPWLAVTMISIGILDIMIGIRLIKMLESKSDSSSGTLKVLAYITLAAGILEVSVIGSFFALILIPVSSIIMAMIFFKEKEAVEFV